MKPIYLFFILYLCGSFLGNANPQEDIKAILMDDIWLQENESLIKAQLSQPQEKKINKKEITLIGQVRAVSPPSKKDSKIVQVVWTGVKGKGKKKASFKEPLISTFKSEKSILSKGLKISLYGNKEHLSDAIGRLEKGEDEQISELKADNPSSSDRRLEDMEGKIKKRHSLRNSFGLDAQMVGNTSHDNASMLSSSEHYLGNSSSSYGEGKNADSLIRKSSNSQNHKPLRRLDRPASQKKPFTGEKIFSNSLNSSPGSTSLSHRPNKDFIESPKEEFDPLKIKQGNASSGNEFNMPLIEVEVTKEGCKPRVDIDRGKVIIQTRSIARTNGVITHETQCADSHLIFDIKKDYGCCSDIVDQQAGFAYTTFKRYWIDEANNKIYLDEHCLKDESQPHPFIEEKGLCSHDIDLESRLAYPQSETVYYNRNHARVLVKACHRTNGMPFAIISTEQGCPLKHLYEQNKSVVQKRDIFIENGITHDVTPCYETAEFVPHHFVKSGCKPVLNGATVIPMAKRQISYKGKTKIIPGQCEPQHLTNLISTREGCEGQYEHDYNSGRSYPLMRAYYQWGNRKRFIDKVCRRSNDPLPHFSSIIGYEHVDLNLKSKPRYQISIKDVQSLLIIKEFTEKDETKWLPYVFEKKVTGEVDSYPPYQQGEYIIFPRAEYNIYTRPDKTHYKVFDKWVSSICIKSVTNITNITQGGSSMSEYDWRASLRNDKK